MLDEWCAEGSILLDMLASELLSERECMDFLHAQIGGSVAAREDDVVVQLFRTMHGPPSRFSLNFDMFGAKGFQQ